MARPTLASQAAQIAALEAALVDKQHELESLQTRIRHDYVEMEEHRRVKADLLVTLRAADTYKEILQRRLGHAMPED